MELNENDALDALFAESLAMRPDPPPNDYAGYHWEAVEERPEWQCVQDDPWMKCRRIGCKNQSALKLDRKRKGKAGYWWYYCELHAYGRWIEDGKVMHWRLVEDEVRTMQKRKVAE